MLTIRFSGPNKDRKVLIEVQQCVEDIYIRKGILGDLILYN